MPQFFDGFGESTSSDLDALRKALSIGYGSPTDTALAGDGTPLRIESLEGTLLAVSYNATHIRFWNRIYKLKARSTVEEFSQLVAYGGDGGGFVDSGVTPEEDDSSYSRAIHKIKYIGTTRGVQHPATLVNTVPNDLVAQETVSGTMWMLGKIEYGLFFADSSIVPQEWDGVIKQIIDGGGEIIDLRGIHLDQADIEDGSQIITDNYGIPQIMYANNKVFGDFSKEYYGQQRWQAPNAPAGMVGTPVRGSSTQAGDVIFDSNMFLKANIKAPSTATHAKSPTTPSISASGVETTGGGIAPTAVGQFTGIYDASYKYVVTAINRYGESEPTTAFPAIAAALSGTDYFYMTIAPGAETTENKATGYKVYRCFDGDTPVFIKRVARDDGATTTVIDVNDDIHGTYTALLSDLSPRSVAFKELSPMLKIPLAVTAPAIRWMQLLYGTPVVYSPKKHVIYKNIGLRP